MIILSKRSDVECNLTSETWEDLTDKLYLKCCFELLYLCVFLACRFNVIVRICDVISGRFGSRRSKMASSKKKQDEKHLKMLREMVALPHNKQCFDCHQRGPTYVNMTIGSYVCTACSGLL